MGVRLVILEEEVVGLVIEEPLPPVLDHKARQDPGITRKLQAGLLDMVRVEMTVAARPNEDPRLEPSTRAPACGSSSA